MAKKILTKRGRVRLYLILLIAFVVIASATFYGRSLARHSSFTTVKKVQIVGNVNLSTTMLQAIAVPFMGENIYEVDLQDVALRYRSVSRIKDVQCKTVFPNKLRVTITERKGVFYIKDTQGEYYPIDEDMVVLDKADWYLNEDLPLINIGIAKEAIKLGEKVEHKQVQAIYNLCSELLATDSDVLDEISEFYFKNNDIHFVDTVSGCRVIVNVDNITEQISRFLFIRNNQGIKKNSTVDLRFDTQVIIS